MKKNLMKFAFTALMFGMFFSVNTVTAKAVSDIAIDESNNISISSEDAANDGITAMQLSIKVTTENPADVSFKFNEDNGVKIAEYRYHSDTGIMNVYMADKEVLFDDSSEDTLDIGAVSAKDSKGNDVPVRIDIEENAVTMVSQNTAKQAVVNNIENATENNVKPKTSSDTETENNAVRESRGVLIQKTYPSSYRVTIPADTQVLAEGKQFNVSASGVMIEHNETLKVAVESENSWKLKEADGNNKSSIRYTMGYGSEKTAITGKSANILNVKAGTLSGETDLTVISVDSPASAGSFSDTLTFSVSVDRK